MEDVAPRRVGQGLEQAIDVIAGQSAIYVIAGQSSYNHLVVG